MTGREVRAAPWAYDLDAERVSRVRGSGRDLAPEAALAGHYAQRRSSRMAGYVADERGRVLAGGRQNGDGATGMGCLHVVAGPAVVPQQTAGIRRDPGRRSCEHGGVGSQEKITTRRDVGQQCRQRVPVAPVVVDDQLEVARQEPPCFQSLGCLPGEPARQGNAGADAQPPGQVASQAGGPGSETPACGADTENITARFGQGFSKSCRRPGEGRADGPQHCRQGSALACHLAGRPLANP